MAGIPVGKTGLAENRVLVERGGGVVRLNRGMALDEPPHHPAGWLEGRLEAAEQIGLRAVVIHSTSFLSRETPDQTSTTRHARMVTGYLQLLVIVGDRMLVTFSEAARIARISKAAVRKAALQSRKLSASRDDNGLWRVDVADVQRLWPRTPVTDDLRTPPAAGDQVGVRSSDQVTIAELRARLEASERILEDREATLRDMRGRLDAEAEERRRLTMLLTDQRAPQDKAPSRGGYWRRLWSGLLGQR